MSTITQSESELEKRLIEHLSSNGYESVNIKNEDDLKKNLKKQIERHNKDVLSSPLSDSEFKRIIHHLDRGLIFDRAKILRNKMSLELDDGEIVYINFLEQKEWCKNIFQVANQITMHGKRENRYDVTLLINGLPLVQIELKKRGISLKESFNQIGRYKSDSYEADKGLFTYIQCFVISNGVNTKYYANTKRSEESFKQTFFWTDKDGKQLSNLFDFANSFLKPCFISKMISQYIILHSSDEKLYIMRSYQYYASEALLEKVKGGRGNGYIWHTTGSGKTLTSFKAAQLISDLDKIQKVVFIVDRTDLDSQTIEEFNNFSEGCVDQTISTKNLVKQINSDKDIIVTTIQKMDRAIKSERFNDVMLDFKRKRVVFIFDECHRGQFGDTNKRICSFFNNPQMFGFTGTPIFAKNAASNRMTTKDVFHEYLHKYIITQAIKDQNVLRFMVEYRGKINKKSDDSNVKVSDINKVEFLESKERVNKIVLDIINQHDEKTKTKDFRPYFALEELMFYINIMTPFVN